MKTLQECHKESRELLACLKKRFQLPPDCAVFPGFPLQAYQSDTMTHEPLLQKAQQRGLLQVLGSVAAQLKGGQKGVARPSTAAPAHPLEELSLQQGLQFQLCEIGDQLQNEDPFHPEDTVHWVHVRNQRVPLCVFRVAAVLRRVSLVSPALVESLERMISNNSLQHSFLDQLERQLNSVDNDAYIEILVSALLSQVATRGWCPSFPLLYACFRADLPDRPPLQFMLQEAVTTNLRSVLERVAPGTMPCIPLLSWLCQITFALAQAQNLMGFIHDHLTPENIGLLKVNQNHQLYYRWNGALLCVPACGFLVKLRDFSRASVNLNNRRIAGQLRRMAPDVFAFNTDLMTLAADLLPLAKRALDRKKSSTATLLKLLQHWVTCGSVRVDRVRQECVQRHGQAQHEVCTDTAFSVLPGELHCLNGIPAAQTAWFRPFFEVKSGQKIPPKTRVFTLDERDETTGEVEFVTQSD